MCNISTLVNGYKSLFARYALIGRQDCSKQLLITAFLGLDEYLARFFYFAKLLNPVRAGTGLNLWALSFNRYFLPNESKLFLGS